VGQGDDLQAFKDQAAASPYADRMIFPGFIDRHKLGGLYELTTVFAFPSLADTQGMVVNEAACAGAPIVMIDHEITEVVINGENGYFARNTVRDFAGKILAILASPKLAAKMSKRSVEIGSKISASNQAAKLLRLYEETIETHRDTAREKRPRLLAQRRDT
jgi:glycosyltransferase involved in cell wall biosynthesis